MQVSTSKSRSKGENVPRDFKFPSPDDYKPAQPAVFCPAERVLNLYNQDSGEIGERIAKKVRIWFRARAHEAGWAGIHFLPEVQSNHGAGCVLWRPPQQINLQVVVTKQTLVLVDESDVNDESE